MSVSEEVKRIARDIFNIDCPTLDVGQRVGHTGYIDFINKNELTGSYVKGIDKHGRKFVSFVATIEYKDGEKKNTFTTLFQRYTGDESVWMGASCGQQLFYTNGGANIEQLKLVHNLLSKKSVDIIEDMDENCRLLESSKFSYSDVINVNPATRIYIS